MGGGDLNLKKSWHPSTLRNIERVWKAEQKHEVEQQKIEELQKELAEERNREEIQNYAEDQGVVKKKEQRLDWMYQGPAAMVDREDYLLGRKIDKTLEMLEQHETGIEPKKEGEFDVGATMFSSQDLSGTATVDLANKIREDPLFNIMKKEKEQRKNLLSNPVKMKQLQQLLQQSLGKEKSKKSKKHKKQSDSDYDEKKHHKKHKKVRHARHSSEEEDRVSRKSSEKLEKRKKLEGRSKGKSSNNYNSNHDEYLWRNRQKTQDRSPKHSRSRSNDYSPRERSNYSDSRHSNSEKMYENAQKKKLDAEERERRLQEMQENAKWREQQRERNTKRYREEDERESKSNKMDTSDFIKPMLSKAAEKGSLENRVKQKIFSIQRGSSAMNQHFARR